MRATLVVFVKAPVAGRVKTRLGRDIGMGRAAAMFRSLMRHTLREAEKSGLPVMLAVDPLVAARADARFWPARFVRAPQGVGDLGARMARVFASAPPGPVIIIGADAPGLRARHLRNAARVLQRADAVFGPAADGGYWLIGLSRRRRAPGLFRHVRWSTDDALADTLESLPADFDVRFLETLRDIDEAGDLEALSVRRH